MMLKKTMQWEEEIYCCVVEAVQLTVPLNGRIVSYAVAASRHAVVLRVNDRNQMIRSNDEAVKLCCSRVAPRAVNCDGLKSGR